MEMISKELQFCITILVTAIHLTTGDGVKLTTKPVIPEIQKELMISCKSSHPGRTFYHNGVIKAGCNKYSCQPSYDPGNGYYYTSDHAKAMVRISSLNRTRDEGEWKCSSSVNQSLTLIAYSFPRSLSFTDAFDKERDLAFSNATLRCQTDGCAYPPSANISWFYKNFTSAPHYIFSGQDFITTVTTRGNCTEPEQIYTSTLALPRYTTAPDNSDTTHTFTCGIQYSDPYRNLNSSDSREIRFAVSVTKVDLQINGQTVTGNSTIPVVSGFVVTITCTAGNSRPVPTIELNIGSQIMALSSNMTSTLKPSNEDHNKVIYCRAYNFRSRTNVESSKAILFVYHAPDVKVTISESDVSNKTIALICEARGVPTNNTFYPWVHMWQNNVIRKEVQGVNNSTHSVLYIDSQVLENIGTYICSATNGVADSNGTNVQTGSKQINYTGLPNIFCTFCIFTGEIGQSVSISIPLYSDPYIKTFQIQKYGLPIMNTNNTKIYLRHEDIGYLMYKTTVLLQAQVVHLETEDLSELDFGNYTLLLNDSILTSTATFQLNPTESPRNVGRFYVTNLRDGLMEMHYDPGYSDGLIQTLYVEYTCDRQRNVWRNASILNLSDNKRTYNLTNGTLSVYINITSLPPGICSYRIYSWNVYGYIQYSEIIEVFIPSGPDTSDNEGRNLFSVLTVPAVVFIAVIAGVTIYQKRKSGRKKAFVDNEINNGIQLRSTQNANSSAPTSGNDASDTSYEDVQDCRTGTSPDQHIDNIIPTAFRHSGPGSLYANTSYSGEASDTGYDILQARGRTGENPYQAISNDQCEYYNQPIALRLPGSSNIYMNTANASTGKGVEHEHLHWTLETI